MARPLVLVGAGGFGRETLDVVRAINRAAAASEDLWRVIGVVDDAPSPQDLVRLHRLEVAFLGPVDVVPDLAADTAVAVGVGSPQARRSIANRAALEKRHFAALIHPTAIMGSDFQIGAGTVACASVSVGTNVNLGQHVHLNTHAVIGHDCVLEDYVSVNPNATVSGSCRVSEGALVGAAAVVMQGLDVGKEAIVGAAACVVRNVSPGTTVMGVPAR